MTAIFVHSDTMAIGVLSALASASRRVPADVAVVSCDDMPFAAYLTPSLSSLRVPFGETGRAAVELLLRSIAGEPAPESTVRLPVELIVRDSCGGRAGAGPPDLTSSSASPAHREKQKEDS
jgi:LacI family transcriptional regulator